MPQTSDGGATPQTTWLDRIPRAWALPVLLLGILILPQALVSLDSAAVLLVAVPLLVASWKVWTRRGRYSVLSLSDAFSAGGRRIGVVHAALWLLAVVLVVLMLIGYVEERIGSGA